MEEQEAQAVEAEKPELRFVNAYAVDRCFGGHEEGGWWYDSGEPLASIPARTDEEVDAAKAVLQEIFGPRFKGNRDRHSVIGEENLGIYVEEHVATAFPDGRPHYE
jgi:hypothetical protein